MYFNCAIILTVHVSTKHCLFVNAPPPPTTHPPTSLVIFSLLVLFLTLITVKKNLLLFNFSFIHFCVFCFVLRKNISIYSHNYIIYFNDKNRRELFMLNSCRRRIWRRERLMRTRTHTHMHTHACTHACTPTHTHPLTGQERAVS